MTKSIPDGFHTVTSSLVVSNSKDAIEFYKKAFDAIEINQSQTPDGKIVHAQIKIGNSFVFLVDEVPPMTKAHTTAGGSTISLHLYVEDADKAFNQAVDAGAKVAMPMGDAFWGDRWGMLTDPYGHLWAIATHQKDLSDEEMKKASENFFANVPK